ncbi:MAG: GAF domain-containing protein [Bacteroidales bacterium]|nr:GAF domain-containing protein [Bacteroidales bacterium]MCF8392207.1 GAF domain-containing protein [Bacteroidales bacterium]
MEAKKKQGRYERVVIQLSDLLKPDHGMLARMATINAVLHHKFEYFFWTGFYLLQNDELIVGPYQGPVACQKLAKNKGVCWAAVNQGKSIVVPDVELFPGHIACDSRSKSEITIPLKNLKGEVIAVFDVDSSEPGSFDEIDRINLEKIIGMVISTPLNNR